jgi:hypothetical protein
MHVDANALDVQTAAFVREVWHPPLPSPCISFSSNAWCKYGERLCRRPSSRWSVMRPKKYHNVHFGSRLPGQQLSFHGILAFAIRAQVGAGE